MRSGLECRSPVPPGGHSQRLYWRTIRGVMMFRKFACGLLVMGAGCTGLEGPPETKPTPGEAVSETGGYAPATDVTEAAPSPVALPPATPGGTWTKLANPPIPEAGFQLL